MDYSKIDKADFDAIVTGELTHFAIWMEDEINTIICDYLIGVSGRRTEFKRLILVRDGLNFHAKIEILRAMLPDLGGISDKYNLKKLLREIEEFKSMRNAMAHGLSVSEDDSNNLKIELVGRSGKTKVINVTPNSHNKMCQDGEELLGKLSKAKDEIRKYLLSLEKIKLEAFLN